MSEVIQLRCPKCGSYNVVDDSAGHLGCLLLTGGLWIFVLLLMSLLGQGKPNPKSGDKLRCDACYYRWAYSGSGES